MIRGAGEGEVEQIQFHVHDNVTNDGHHARLATVPTELPMEASYNIVDVRTELSGDLDIEALEELHAKELAVQNVRTASACHAAPPSSGALSAAVVVQAQAQDVAVYSQLAETVEQGQVEYWADERHAAAV